MEHGKMSDLLDMIWIEYKKAARSRMILWTVLASLLLPLGIAFLIFVSKNPEISQKLGLVSAKADLVAFAGTDWPTYAGFFGQVISAGGFILGVFVISWIFGREFSDGTVKDMLAVPVRRSNILLAKFILAAAWSLLLTAVIFAGGLWIGLFLGLPGASITAILQESVIVAITAGLVIPAVFPFALFASLGRGYLLPIAVAAFVMMLINLSFILGRGEYFPWAVPMIYAQGETVLSAVSYWIVLLTGAAGLAATHLWWKEADQSR
jgi:ABC-2 type transport system permease protein